MRPGCRVFLASLSFGLLLAHAQPTRLPGRPPQGYITLPGTPFGIAHSSDGAWLFAALTANGQTGIAVLQYSATSIKLAHTIPLTQAPTGIVMTHDGQLLIAAAGPLVYFLDVGNLIGNGTQSVLGAISDGAGAGSIDVDVTTDDRWLFVADENLDQITVIDLDRARSGGYPQDAIVGTIPTGVAPTQVKLSADEQWLYSTSEVALPSWGWPRACIQEGQTANQTLVNPQGAVVVANITKAVSSPAQSVASRVPAGCSPVRMALSPSGDRMYVTMRNNNAVEALDTSQFISNPSGALLGSAAVGTAPVPVAVLDSGRLVLVGNSDRFEAPTSPQTLSLLNAADIASGGSALLATLPTGAFPRTISLSRDLRTLYVSDFGSNMLQVLDVAMLISADVTAR